MPLGAIFVVVLVFVSQRAGFFETVLRTRVDTSGRGTSTHFVVYEFIPHVLSQHPLFGLGLNNFSVYYEFVTGRNNFGPHSFYVALFVESGIVGAAALPRLPRLPLPPALGRPRDRTGPAAAGDGLAARVRPLEWGLTAALVATMASNFFYLTMSFYYFFVFAMLAIVAPAVFVRRLAAVVKVCVLTTSYPRHPGDVAGAFVADGSSTSGRPGSRCGSSRPRRSATSGSPTATASRTTCARGRGSCCCCRSSSSRSRALPDGRRVAPTSCTPTGCRPRVRGWPPASRSSCRPGAPTSSSRSGCRGSSGRC